LSTHEIKKAKGKKKTSGGGKTTKKERRYDYIIPRNQ
jgi:hypothetical protein